MGWIGVDLDGTIAHYQPEDFNPLRVGDPIEGDVLREVRRLIRIRRDVRIFTARANPMGWEDLGIDVADVVKAIQDWTDKHLGKRLPVTYQKDYMMEFLIDDRCREVIFNEGKWR